MTKQELINHFEEEPKSVCDLINKEIDFVKDMIKHYDNRMKEANDVMIEYENEKYNYEYRLNILENILKKRKEEKDNE